MKKLILAFSILSIISCKQAEEKSEASPQPIETEPNQGIGDGAPALEVSFAQNIENAHNKQDWEKEQAVSFDVDLQFGGKQRLDAKVTTFTNSTRVRLDRKDGSKLIYDGEQVYLCPADANEKGARFDTFTWQYFFAMPFKLTDPGTNWEIINDPKSANQEFNKAKLTFGDNIGDAPDDWYVVYQEPKSGLLHAAAYIVTYGTAQEKAEENPHAIVYHDYKVIKGIPVATRWTFHNWGENEGIQDQIGEATISNIVFFNAKKDLFEKPENSKVIEK
jgi:hypothetical protein